MSTIEIFGFEITGKDYPEIIRNSLADFQSPFVISTLNVPMFKEAYRNRIYNDALSQSHVVIPDGIGIVLASRLIHGKTGLKGRITGPDLLVEFSKIANQKGLKFYFLGSSAEVLKKIGDRMAREFSNIDVVGLYSPPFGEWSSEVNEEIIRDINKVTPDVLWVGMTAPKQEIWVCQNRDRLKARVIGSIGAAFDFFAGSTKRAPRWIRKMGMEWLFRVIQEPLRIGRRYTTTIPFFLIFFLKNWIIKKKNSIKEKRK